MRASTLSNDWRMPSTVERKEFNSCVRASSCAVAEPVKPNVATAIVVTKLIANRFGVWVFMGASSAFRSIQFQLRDSGAQNRGALPQAAVFHIIQRRRD